MNVIFKEFYDLLKEFNDVVKELIEATFGRFSILIESIWSLFGILGWWILIILFSIIIIPVCLIVFIVSLIDTYL